MKLKFQFEVELEKEPSKQELALFLENARRELSFLAYGNPCKAISELKIIAHEI